MSGNTLSTFNPTNSTTIQQMLNFLNSLRSVCSFTRPITANIAWACVLAQVTTQSYGGWFLLLLVMACMTSWAYFRWDAMPLTWNRLGLYGLYVASEVFGIWAVVYAVLASTKVVEPSTGRVFFSLSLLALSHIILRDYASRRLAEAYLVQAPKSDS